MRYGTSSLLPTDASTLAAADDDLAIGEPQGLTVIGADEFGPLPLADILGRLADDGRIVEEGLFGQSGSGKCRGHVSQDSHVQEPPGFDVARSQHLHQGGHGVGVVNRPQVADGPGGHLAVFAWRGARAYESW